MAKKLEMVFKDAAGKTMNVNFQIKLGSFSHIVTGSNGPFLSN